MKYILYFVIGGIVVSSVTYLAGQARGLLAAFVANLPVITLITFLISISSPAITRSLHMPKGW